MSRVKKLIIGTGIAAATLLLCVAGAWIGVTTTAQAELAREVDAHRADVPVPWPLAEAEIASLRAEVTDALLQARETAANDPGAQSDASAASATLSDVDPAVAFTDEELGIDLNAVALERALERGRYLLAARYPCAECHGEDFGGGVMIDDPLVGVLEGPNLTAGAGGVTSTYGPGDWDRAIRHGIKPNGRVSMMPSVDFFAMSDRELSDILAVIRAAPPVDRAARPVTLGPLGSVLVATGAFVMSADRLDRHDVDHLSEPPSPQDTLAYGGHIAQPCVGCHRADFSGGPIVGAPPDWPPATNLTPHQEGAPGLAFDDFARALREGIGRDGAVLRAPMSDVPRMARQMSDEDLRAMFAYLASLDPQPTGR